MTEINKTIEADNNLGKEYQIGHSYFCPQNGNNDKKWFDNVVNHEILPLLEEYYFDAGEKASELIEHLKS